MEVDDGDIDGGWAWVVMVATYVGMVIYCNSMYMGGVIYLELLRKFHAGAANTSLVGALSTGLLCFAAPIAGIIINKYSCRVAIISGGIFSTVGFAIGAFVPSLSLMILTAGVIVGFGYSLSSAGLICAVGFYFQKRRSEMISAAFFMVGFAVFTSAPFGLVLFNTQGFSGGLLILAGIQAQMCVIGMLCKPSVLEKQVHVQRKVVRTEKSEFRLEQYLDLSLMKNAAFVCFLISTSSWNFAMCVGIIHLPNYVSVLGGTTSDINLLMTSFSVANIIGRLIGTITLNRFSLKSLHAYVTVIGISGVITTTFPLYAKLVGGAYVFAVQLGLFCGWPNGMMTPIAVQFVGVAKMSEAYGLVYLFCGFGVTPGPVIIGAVYGATNSYESSFLVAGVVLLVGAVFGIASLCLGRMDAREGTLEVKATDDVQALTNGHTLEVKATDDIQTLTNRHTLEVNSTDDAQTLANRHILEVMDSGNAEIVACGRTDLTDYANAMNRS